MGGDRPAIGIDLGTTYSCVAVWRNGQAEIIPNDQGNRITPSIVVFSDDQRFVGDAAKNEAPKYPTNTVFDVKRLLGKSFNDISVQNDMKQWSFKVTHNPEDVKPMVVVRCNDVDKQFAPEQISAMVLAKLKKMAEKFVGETVTDVVVTVPAYFNDSQRRATIDAGDIAGLNVIQIINEPTAAAIAYGLSTKVCKEKNVLVFDLGGGTFDVSILSINGGNYSVKAVCGDPHLGGQDFDNRMVNYLVDYIKDKYGKNIRVNPKTMGRLRTECERAKRMLSSNSHVSMIVYGILDDGEDFHYKFSRAKFEELNIELLRTCMELTAMCLKDANMSKEDIHDVVLVGGSTRIIKVQQLLKEFFSEKQLCNNINPDEAVAQGAAARAASLLCNQGTENVCGVVLDDVTPLSLGWEAAAQVYNIVIPRNTRVPCRMSFTALNNEDYQMNMFFKIYQGERARAPDNHYLGEFSLNVPPAKRGVPNAELWYDIDANGIFTISAMQMVGGSKKRFTLSSDKGKLSSEDIKRMLKEAQDAEIEDNKFRRNIEAKNAFECYIGDMRNLINDARVAGKMTPHERTKIEEAIAKATTWVDSNLEKANASDYEMMTKFLESIWEPIVKEHGSNQVSSYGGKNYSFSYIALKFGLKASALISDIVLSSLVGVAVPMISNIVENLPV